MHCWVVQEWPVGPSQSSVSCIGLGTSRLVACKPAVLLCVCHGHAVCDRGNRSCSRMHDILAEEVKSKQACVMECRCCRADVNQACCVCCICRWCPRCGQDPSWVSAGHDVCCAQVSGSHLLVCDCRYMQADYCHTSKLLQAVLHVISS
jgi:hypothetical protein